MRTDRRERVAIVVAAALVASVLVWHVTTDQPDVLLVGDSIMRQTGPGLEAALSGYEVRNRAVNGSGLLNPDDRDWIRQMPEELHRYWPRAVVILFIGNYTDAAHRWRDDDGVFVDKNSAAFFEEWAEEANELLDVIDRESDAEVYLVLPPPMLSPANQATVNGLRRVYRRLAEQREGVTLIDANRALAGPGGEYLAEAPGPNGDSVPLRRADGVHLHDAGSARLGAEIARVIEG